MALATGDEDKLSDPLDVKWLLDEAQSGIKSELIVFHKQYHFDHGSFTMSIDASYLDNDIIPLIK